MYIHISICMQTYTQMYIHMYTDTRQHMNIYIQSYKTYLKNFNVIFKHLINAKQFGKNYKTYLIIYGECRCFN